MLLGTIHLLHSVRWSFLIGLWMSFVVLNCQVVEWVDIFANPVFKHPGIYNVHSTKKSVCSITTCLFYSKTKRYNEPLVLHSTLLHLLNKNENIINVGYWVLSENRKINSQRHYCHSIYTGSNKYIFVPLHDIFMPNKTYSNHCIIYLCLYNFKNIYGYCTCWSAELVRSLDGRGWQLWVRDCYSRAKI